MSYITTTYPRTRPAIFPPLQPPRAFGYDSTSMEGLGGRVKSIYDDVIAENGKLYQVYFQVVGLSEKALKTVLAFVHDGRDNLESYQYFWNQAYSNRFKIVQKPTLLPGNIIMLKGTGGSTSEKFGSLLMDQYWAAATPIWQRSSLLFGIHIRIGLKGVSYLKILLGDGRDAVTVQKEELEKAVNLLNEPPPSGSGVVVAGAEAVGDEPTKKIPWPLIIGGSAGVLVLGTVVALLATPKKVATATNARRHIRRH